MAELLYQGHGSFRLSAQDGTVVYVDPFAGTDALYEAPADLILSTHEHLDHIAFKRMPHAPGCELFRAADTHPDSDTYLTFTSHGIRFTAVEAYNQNHPKDECVGYVIEVDGISLYAAGDTALTEDMSSGKLAAMALDYALLPGDGIYTMDIPEMNECARLVDARHTIPYHMEPVHGEDDTTPAFPRERAEAFQGPGRIILEPGETLELEPYTP